MEDTTGPITVTMQATYAPWFDLYVSTLSHARLCVSQVSPRFGLWLFNKGFTLGSKYGIRMTLVE